MYLCGRGIDFASFCEFAFGFWNCSDSVLFFGFFLYFMFYDIKKDLFSLYLFIT